jgi:hypothetical protein
MGASAARGSDSAIVSTFAELDATIPRRMARALSGLATVSYAEATQVFGPRGGGHPGSSVPRGVLDSATIDELRRLTGPDGSALRERSLQDYFSGQWQAARFSSFRRRLVCYQAELALDEARRGPLERQRVSALEFEHYVLGQRGVDALELAVKLRCELVLVKGLRTVDGQDPDFGGEPTRRPQP